MAKRISNTSKSRAVKTKTIQLMLPITAKLEVNGNRYIFEGAGSTLTLPLEDANALLAKTIGEGCCGARSKGRMFQEI